MREEFTRTKLTFGSDNMEKLSKAHVIVFGVGGVGSYVVEALVRSGIGAIDLVDSDTVAPSNINRQLIALQSTIGQFKVDSAEARIHDINPDCKVTKFKTFFLPETADTFDFTKYDYVIDCIDTVSGKIALVLKAKEAKVPVICSMGAGNKVDPTKFQVADISRTSVCPLARVMRQELKKRNIKRLKCVFSTEKIIPPEAEDEEQKIEQKNLSGGQTPIKKQTPGSNAFTPSVAGLIIAGEVIKDLTSFHVTDLFAKN